MTRPIPTTDPKARRRPRHDIVVDLAALLGRVIASKCRCRGAVAVDVDIYAWMLIQFGGSRSRRDPRNAPEPMTLTLFADGWERVVSSAVSTCARPRHPGSDALPARGSRRRQAREARGQDRAASSAGGGENGTPWRSDCGAATNSKALRGNYISWHVEQGVTDGTEALHLDRMRLAVPMPTESMRTPASPIGRPVASTRVYGASAKAIGPLALTNR
jgi:hypothetical protein